MSKKAIVTKVVVVTSQNYQFLTFNITVRVNILALIENIMLITHAFTKLML
jgi:hypothetical protein